MKIRKSIVVASAVAVVPLTLGMSTGPASAMTKSCITMYSGYVQASLASNYADATMTSFEDNVQDYVDANGYYRRTGTYFDLAGHLQHYDMDPSAWSWQDAIHTDVAAQAEADEADAYDDYMSACGY
jgi:hypothetical protein